MWSGHSCPLLLTLTLRFCLRIKETDRLSEQPWKSGASAPR